MNNALLLDRNYMAVSVINWKRAVKLFVVGKAEIIEEYTKEISGEKLTIKMPSVIRLLNAIPFKSVAESRIKFNRINVFIRDDFKCRYCGVQITKYTGTIDHVIPKSLGGLSTYENCVSACKNCNNYKGNLLLSKAGMNLEYRPRKPTFWELYIKNIKNAPIEWNKYLLD